MKTKKVLNIKPQEFCEGDDHYVRYKGCDGRMHELPTHTVTHNERVKEMFITQIDELHSVTMDAELTNPEARAVFQASFPNAIEVKDIPEWSTCSCATTPSRASSALMPPS